MSWLRSKSRQVLGNSGSRALVGGALGGGPGALIGGATGGNFNNFLFGSPDRVRDPHETAHQRRMREALEKVVHGGLANYDPNAVWQQGQNAYNNYNTNMQGLMSGTLPQAFNDNLNSIRDNNPRPLFCLSENKSTTTDG